MADTKEGPTLERDFSKVILTLDNVLIPHDKLSPTPSLLDGLDSETETDLRILGCELIQTAGILLKLPQVAMATGQVLYQRFYYSKSFVKHNMEVLAMACVNLASKIEEAPRRIRDVINVFHHIKQVRNGKTIQPLILDQHYINLKNQVIKAERRILKELGFCVHVQHPHKIIVMYLRQLECERNRKLVQAAWNYMNDSFRTNVFVQYQPETIGCACIYLAARQLQIPLPNSPPWFAIFNVEEDEIQDICMSILKLYARPKPNYDELEKIVNEAKKIQIEAKLKAKGRGSEQGTPNSNSRPCTPKNVSPNPSLLASIKRIKSEADVHGNGTPAEKTHSKKRSRSPDHRRGSSKSRSTGSRSSRSRSRSLTRSPVPKSRKYRSPAKKQKKYQFSPDRYKEKHHSHKHEKRRKRSSLPRSLSRSPSPSPEHKHSHKKYYKEKDRYRSPEPHRRSHKHRNGHNSPIRDKYSKYYRR